MGPIECSKNPPGADRSQKLRRSFTVEIRNNIIVVQLNPLESERTEELVLFLMRIRLTDVRAKRVGPFTDIPWTERKSVSGV